MREIDFHKEVLSVLQEFVSEMKAIRRVLEHQNPGTVSQTETKEKKVAVQEKVATLEPVIEEKAVKSVTKK